MQKKNVVLVSVLTVVVALIFVAYFFGWQIGAALHKDSTANNIDELTLLINTQIDEGKESGNIYVANVSVDEINNINNRLCTLNGSVLKYSITEKMKGGMRIKFVYQISDNYYVIDRYLNQNPIPSDRPIAQVLFEKVTEIIDKIITPDMTDYEKELAIHDYIVGNCDYGYVDNSKEYAYRAYGCLIQNKAVCSGYTEAMALLLTCAGVENKIVTGYGKEELHAWNQVKLDGQWYNVDSTWNDKQNYVGHTYFNVTDDVMDNEHTWEEENFEVCTSDDYNYYVMYDMLCNYDVAYDKIMAASLKDPYATIEIALTDYDEDTYGSFSFLCDNPNVKYFSYSIEECGSYTVATLYLNQKE